MKFPEAAREGSAAHADALRRLDEARNQERKKKDALEEAKDTDGELAAATELSRARETVSAGQAWASWVERGY